MREANAARSNGAMIQVTILSRQDCHLCEVAMGIARRLQAEIPFCLNQLDVANDPGLSAQYGHRIPVILIDQVESCAGKVTERELRRAIKRARWRRPISRILSRLGFHPRRG